MDLQQLLNLGRFGGHDTMNVLFLWNSLGVMNHELYGQVLGDTHYHLSFPFGFKCDISAAVTVTHLPQ